MSHIFLCQKPRLRASPPCITLASDVLWTGKVDLTQDEAGHWHYEVSPGQDRAPVGHRYVRAELPGGKPWKQFAPLLRSRTLLVGDARSYELSTDELRAAVEQSLIAADPDHGPAIAQDIEEQAK